MLLLSLLAALIGSAIPATVVSADDGGQQVWCINATPNLIANTGLITGAVTISSTQQVSTSDTATQDVTFAAGDWKGHIALSTPFTGTGIIRIGTAAGFVGSTSPALDLTASTGFDFTIAANALVISTGQTLILEFQTLSGTMQVQSGGHSFIISPPGSPAFPDPAQTTTYGLMMSVSGSGSTSPAASATAYNYYNGTVVPLSATAASGYHFTGWSGSITGTTNPTTLTLNGAKNITANFAADASPTYSLTMAVSPGSAGTTSPSIGAHVYDAGTNVPIQAAAAGGYTFVNWSGAGIANPAAASTTVTADQNKTVTANFISNAVVNLILSLSTNTALVGTTFDVVIQAQSGGQAVVGIDACLDFDPAKLAVVDMVPGTAGIQISGGASLSMPLQNLADNTTGHIDYSAGSLSPYPSGTFTVATIRFQALAATSPTTAVAFSTSGLRSTEVSGDVLGTNVTGTLTGGVYTIASGVNVGISVGLQGAGRPGSAWIVPLTVKFFTTGSNVLTAVPLYNFTLTSTRVNNTAVIQCPAISPGHYDISAVSSHTLINVKRNVTIDLSSTPVSLGTLLEGNANNDIRINITDFSVLSGSYGKAAADQGYNAAADFDGSGTVDISDFSLLSGNYNLRSPIEVP